MSELNSLIAFLCIFIPVVLVLRKFAGDRKLAADAKEHERIASLSPDEFAKEFGPVSERTMQQYQVAAIATIAVAAIALLAKISSFGTAFADLGTPLGPIVFSAVVSALVLMGGINMLRYQRYVTTLIGSVLLAFPYFGIFYGLLLPLGVWNLTLLTQPRVKNLFRGDRSTSA